MAYWWPVELGGRGRDGAGILLRPMNRRDRFRWDAIRRENGSWLRQWDSTVPERGERAPAFRQMVRLYDREARAGRMSPFAVVVDGVLVGQLQIFGITWGSLRSGSAGYWIARSHAGRGIMPIALAMLCDHGFGSMGLHRVEVNIRPENHASLRVVAKLGFRDEGVRARYQHIDGEWRDHRTFALTTEDLAGGRVAHRLTDPSHQPLRRHTEPGPK